MADDALPKLRRCPFCRGDVLYLTSNGTYEMFVECSGCGTSGPAGRDAAKACEKWNARPSDINWQTIDEFALPKKGIAPERLFFYPEGKPGHGRNLSLGKMIRVDRVSAIPRQPTHFAEINYPEEN